MRDLVRISLGIFLTVVIYTLLEKISFSTILIFNVFNLVVLYFAREKGETSGALLGLFCGMIQDSFSGGVFGVAGISKTISGFLAGVTARKMDVVTFRRSFMYIFVFSGLELVIWAFLYTLIFSERINTGGGVVFFQPLGTALLGSLVFLLIRILSRFKHKRRHEE